MVNLAAKKFQLMAWYLLTAELAGHFVQQLKQATDRIVMEAPHLKAHT